MQYLLSSKGNVMGSRPTKGGIELSPVQMQGILQLFTVEHESQKLRESQKGMKFRTICSECNSYLGSEILSPFDLMPMKRVDYFES